MPWLLFCGLLTQGLNAQDIVALNSVEVFAKKINFSQTGKKTEIIDSTIKQQFGLNSLAELLSFNTPIFIKSYGSGALATTAFRGGNASQTAVLWNGFNLQNAMLGQSDLSLMPAILFDDVELEYGGSSSLWGSGAVGGSIHLNSKNKFNQGFVTTVNAGAGSFGLCNGFIHGLISKKRFVSSTKLYLNRSNNNFLYGDSLDKEQPLKTQKNAAYNFRGMMQEFKFMINPKQLLVVNSWLNSNQRRLPAINPSAESKTYQLDASLKLTANWSYVKTKFRSIARGAVFYDQIQYSDSLISLFDKSKVRTVMAENENFFHWAKNQQLHVGLNFSSSSATSSNYDGQRSMSRVSLLAGNRSVFFNGRFVTCLSARSEYISVGALPLTGNVSAEYHLFKNVITKINVAKVYRQPTLNDLYWLPGGNSELKPEQGFTFEGEINYRKDANAFSFFVSGAAFSRKINNWILWVPGNNGNPSPLNIQQVWSRGTETNFKVTYTKNKLKLGFNLSSAYVLSTVESNRQENSDNLKRQLIYTPRYTVNGHVFVSYKNISLFYFHQYIGYRFTSSDNLIWLNPYQLSSIKLNYNIKLRGINLSLFAACNNCLNNSYTIIAARPMPLRNYELGLSIRFGNNKK